MRYRVQLDVVPVGNSVRIEVADEGIGIPKKDQERLCQSFHRAANTGAISGTGLGLTIVNRFVSLQDGTLECQSEERQGTTFSVTIPLPSHALSNDIQATQPWE